MGAGARSDRSARSGTRRGERAWAAPLARFVEGVVARVAATPVSFAQLAPDAAPGSLLAGASGVALFLHEAAGFGDDVALALLARAWCRAARGWANGATSAGWRGSAFGAILGEGGLAHVEALLALRDGDGAEVLAAATRIARAGERVPELGAFPSTELFAGAAGLARLAASLHARLPVTPDFDAARGVLAGARGRAVDLVLDRYRAASPVAPDALLGFAHGVAGELWSLVTIVGAEHDVVRRRLAELAALRERDEEGLVYWLPAGGGEATMLGALCNGMPGHTVLWCEVFAQTRSDAAASLARECAESTDVLRTWIPTLCCGLAGQAVALQRYASVSGDHRFAVRAYARLRRAIRAVDAGEAIPFLGLWQGALGVAWAAMACLREKPARPLEPLVIGG